MRNKQNIIDHNGVNPMYTTTALSKEQFKEFYTFLNIIKPHFVDFCIVNGQFRSRSNCRVCVVEAYFEYFNSMDFIISDIKMLVKMLSALSKRNKITVTVDNENVYFTDGYQTLKKGRIPSEYCDNAFVTENELNDLLIKVIDSNKPLIKQTLPKALVCNINKMANNIGVNSITFKHAEDSLNKGCLVISSIGQSGNTAQEYEIRLKNNLLTTIDKDHYFKIPNISYIFNKSDMTLDFSFTIDKNILSIIHNTKVDKLSISIYARAAYCEPDNE